MTRGPQTVTLNLTLGASSQKVLSNDPARRYALVSNTSAGTDIYFAFGRPATANDHLLKQDGGTLELSVLAPWTGELWLIGNGATVAITSW